MITREDIKRQSSERQKAEDLLDQLNEKRRDSDGAVILSQDFAVDLVLTFRRVNQQANAASSLLADLINIGWAGDIACVLLSKGMQASAAWDRYFGMSDRARDLENRIEELEASDE